MRDDLPPARRTALQRIVRRSLPPARLQNPELRVAYADPAVAQDAGAQAAAAGEKLLRTRSERGVHPVARFAMRRAMETHTLQFEVRTDQFRQVDSGYDHVTPEHARDISLGRSARDIQADDFARKKVICPL